MLIDLYGIRMVDSNTTESPLETAIGAAGPHATSAFGLVANETRLATLLALWEAYEPHASTTALSFTELRDRVGIRQGSQFNYHLDKLVGEFVRKTDEGYDLTPTGLRLVQSIIAGTGIEDPMVEPTEVDDTCELCGAPTAITYQESRVYQVCTDCPGGFPDSDHPEGALTGWTFEPTGVTGRTAEELFAASTVKNYGRIALRFEGICPDCSGPVEWSFDVCGEHDPPADGGCPNCGRDEAVLAKESCRICKSSGQGSPGIKVLFHPAVISFFYDHGIEIGFTGDTEYADVVRTMNLVEEFDEEVVSTEPLCVRVTVTYDSDELRLLLDENMDVVEISEQS